MISAAKGLIARSVTLAQRYAQAYAEGDMLGSGRLIRPVDPVWDSVLNTMVNPADVVLYTGPLRVSTVSGPVTYDMGDGPQYYSSTPISLPLGLVKRPEVNDVVIIDVHPDPAVAGRTFRVMDVEAGGQLPAVYRLQCVGVQPWREHNP